MSLRRRKHPDHKVNQDQIDHLFDEALVELDATVAKLRTYIALRRASPASTRQPGDSDARHNRPDRPAAP